MTEERNTSPFDTPELEEYERSIDFDELEEPLAASDPDKEAPTIKDLPAPEPPEPI